MQAFKIIWSIVKYITEFAGVIGLFSIFTDIKQFGGVMSYLAPYIETSWFQALSVVLIILLIVDATLKYQHKISFINSDFISMIKGLGVRNKHQNTKPYTLDSVSSDNTGYQEITSKSNESTYDDMSLIELFDYLKNNVDYSDKFKELDGEDVAFKIAIDIKDNASQNRLDLSARIYDKQFDQFLEPINQLEKIKLDDWNDFSFTMNLEDGEIQAENENNTYNGNIYRDIQVERKQAVSIWPEKHKPILSNNQD